MTTRPLRDEVLVEILPGLTSDTIEVVEKKTCNNRALVKSVSEKVQSRNPDIVPGCVIIFDPAEPPVAPGSLAFVKECNIAGVEVAA